jgi:hypothetical protein
MLAAHGPGGGAGGRGGRGGGGFGFGGWGDFTAELYIATPDKGRWGWRANLLCSLQLKRLSFNWVRDKRNASSSSAPAQPGL